MQFLSDWLSRDPSCPAHCWKTHRTCNTRQLRHELDRFTFLLDSSDGGTLSGPPQW